MTQVDQNDELDVEFLSGRLCALEHIVCLGFGIYGLPPDGFNETLVKAVEGLDVNKVSRKTKGSVKFKKGFGTQCAGVIEFLT